MGDQSLARPTLAVSRPALAMLFGSVAIVVLTDVAHFSRDHGLAVLEWAARALVTATRQPGHQVINHHAFQRGIGELAVSAPVSQLDPACWFPQPEDMPRNCHCQ